MPTIYNQDPCWVEPLKFSDIFPDAETFESLVQKISSDQTHLKELYEILALRYSGATTRYMTLEPFVLALKSVLFIEWDLYLTQRSLIQNLKSIEIDDVMKLVKETTSETREQEGSSETNLKDLQNEVNANNSPIVDADTIAIKKNKSNRQISNIGSNDSIAQNQESKK